VVHAPEGSDRGEDLMRQTLVLTFPLVPAVLVALLPPLSTCSIPQQCTRAAASQLINTETQKAVTESVFRQRRGPRGPPKNSPWPLGPDEAARPIDSLASAAAVNPRVLREPHDLIHVNELHLKVSPNAFIANLLIMLSRADQQSGWALSILVLCSLEQSIFLLLSSSGYFAVLNWSLRKFDLLQQLPQCRSLFDQLSLNKIFCSGS